MDFIFITEKMMPEMQYSAIGVAVLLFGWGLFRMVKYDLVGRSAVSAALFFVMPVVAVPGLDVKFICIGICAAVGGAGFLVGAALSHLMHVYIFGLGQYETFAVNYSMIGISGVFCLYLFRMGIKNYGKKRQILFFLNGALGGLILLLLAGGVQETAGDGFLTMMSTHAGNYAPVFLIEGIASIVILNILSRLFSFDYADLEAAGAEKAIKAKNKKKEKEDIKKEENDKVSEIDEKIEKEEQLTDFGDKNEEDDDNYGVDADGSEHSGGDTEDKNRNS